MTALPLAPVYDDEARVAATWQRLADARDRRTRRRRGLRVAALPALALVTVGAAIAVAVVVRTPARPGALASTDPGLRVESGAEVAAATARTAVALDDGSRLVLDAGARMQVLSNDGERFSTLLERGTIAYSVHPGGPRRWEIETALATIEVVGTRFVVAQDARAVTVSVEHGIVMVRGERVAGRVQRLTAGQRLEIRSGAATTAAAPAEVPGSATEVGSQPAAPATGSATEAGSQPAAPATGSATEVGSQPAAPATGSATAAGSQPADAAASGSDRAPAGRAVRHEAGGPRAGVPAGPSLGGRTGVRPAEAGDPAAVARAALAATIERADRLRPVDPQAAATLLEGALANHPDDSAAGLAAFALGRLYLESLGQPGRAAEVFRRIVNRGAPRGLLEDAHARLVEALLASGDRDAARDALRDYEHAYPDGRRTAALRNRLAVP